MVIRDEDLVFISAENRKNQENSDDKALLKMDKNYYMSTNNTKEQKQPKNAILTTIQRSKNKILFQALFS